MLEANGIVNIDENHNTTLTRKGSKYIERNELEISERGKILYDRKIMKDKQKDTGSLGISLYTLLVLCVQICGIYF